ncbi:hypothetical protein [Actinomycetospora sp. TBRC 11914]|uniref:hypothetical protein n=1 Tax=Actinomycetospora sp. TBRC 11914 TaxID=2729387 RepID=UPI00145EDC38|nr:hypothetical protein [Actinomycetospora sp. TBRC 11914]NMO90990.1 hypothetical protein [Actinomycetospora sp. TBRC 11914]
MDEWIAEVGPENAELLATRSRTAVLASEYRPKDLGDGRIHYSKRALGAARELSEEEDGAITEDGEGLRVWVGEDAFDLDEV